MDQLTPSSPDTDSTVADFPGADPTAGGVAAPGRSPSRWHRRRLPRGYSPGRSVANALRFWIRPGNLLAGVLFLVLCAIYVLQASVYWQIVIDDSYITFRFVDNFVRGFGWVYNPEGPRVEGFTNFLWAVMLLIPQALGWDLMFVSKIMGLVCGCATMAASWGFARSVRGRDDLFNLIPAAFLATNAHFAHWSMMGMETLLQTALVTAAYWRFEAERRDLRLWQISPLFAVLAAMTRIDSLYYLAPLGFYGWWMVFLCRMPVKRLLRWAVLAAVPFLVYWGWRYTYFGDMLPNTYYAKQRLVPDENRGMANAQLFTFYFDQAGFGIQKPPPRLELAPDASERLVRAHAEMAKWDAADRVLYNLSLSSRNNWLWLNLWAGSLLLCLMVPVLPMLLRRRDRRRFGMWRNALPAVACLILLPWAMNVYYVHHVNGDWMPNFRFFQILLPFIGVALAVGLGAIPAFLAMRGLLVRVVAKAGTGLLAIWLLVGNAYEQLHIETVSVYGKDSIYWAKRQRLWFTPEKIRVSYKRGFSPPLNDVSNWLLLNTVDGGAIFMSDIGQPLWYAEHLDLFDVDGLTDPWLSHAPSRRGRIPPRTQIREEMLERMRRERGRDLETAELAELERRTRRREFELFLDRNAQYVMEDRQPEYLLIFLNHERPDPKSRGWAYPEISSRVYARPEIANYIDDAQIPKIGNVYNHIFRRKNVEQVIPDEVKLKRMFRAIERNPRMPLLVVLLLQESGRMQNVSQEDSERIVAIFNHAVDRWADDATAPQIASAARFSAEPEIAGRALEKMIQTDPTRIDAYFRLAGLYQERSNLAKAAQIMESALEYIPGDNNSVHYHLGWLYEQLGRVDDAARMARTAAERRPDESRAWSDLASYLDRGSANQSLDTAVRIQMKRDSIQAFEKMMQVVGRREPHLQEAVARLGREIRALETPPPAATTVPAETAVDPPAEQEVRPVEAIRENYPSELHLRSMGTFLGDAINSPTETNYRTMPPRETEYR